MEPDLQKQAHDNAVKAGETLAEAQLKLDKAEKLLTEAGIRMSNARKFEEVLKERQKKLDRAFILLNRQKRSLQAQQLKENERQLIIDDNVNKF